MCECFSLGCVSEHVSILALGEMSKCMNLKGMPTIFVIIYICMNMLFVSGHTCELCVCVSVHILLQVSECVVFSYELNNTWMYVYLSM